MIPAWHPQITQQELWEESQIESGENEKRGKLGKRFRVQLSTDFRPPKVQAAKIGHDHAADHNVMEMSHHKIGIGKMDINRERGEKKAGQATDREQADKTERVKKRGLKPDRAAIKGGRPVENLDCGWDRNQKAEEREDHARVDRLAADEHVMTPDEEA